MEHWDAGALDLRFAFQALQAWNAGLECRNSLDILGMLFYRSANLYLFGQVLKWVGTVNIPCLSS